MFRIEGTAGRAARWSDGGGGHKSASYAGQEGGRYVTAVPCAVYTAGTGYVPGGGHYYGPRTASPLDPRENARDWRVVRGGGKRRRIPLTLRPGSTPPVSHQPARRPGWSQPG